MVFPLNLAASLIPAACLIGVTQSGCNDKAVVVLLIVGTCFYGSMFSGVFSNHVDIASNFAGRNLSFPHWRIFFSKRGLCALGVLMGMSNMGATIPGFLVPTIVAVLTHGRVGNLRITLCTRPRQQREVGNFFQNDLAPWHNVFYLTAGLLLLEFVLYTLMASGVEQEWNKVPEHMNQVMVVDCFNVWPWTDTIPFLG